MEIFPLSGRTSRLWSMPAEPAPDLSAARRSRADRARQIADVLRRQIASGTYSGETAGDRLLPGEAELAAEFGASRNAVREALAILVSEGVVTRVQGTGTVAAGVKVQHGLARLTGLAETLTEHGEIVNEIRAAGLVTAPSAVAERLALGGSGPDAGTGKSGTSTGSAVVCIERLRRLNGLPLSLDLTYLAPDIGERLLGQDLEHRDLFALIEATSGQKLGGAAITIEALNADPHTAAVLQTPPGAALVMVERLTRLADGRPVDLEYIRLRGDRLALRGDLTRDA